MVVLRDEAFKMTASAQARAPRTGIRARTQVVHAQFLELPAVVLPAVNEVPGNLVAGVFGAEVGEARWVKGAPRLVMLEPAVRTELRLAEMPCGRFPVDRMRKEIEPRVDRQAHTGKTEFLGIAWRQKLRDRSVVFAEHAARRRRVERGSGRDPVKHVCAVRRPGIERSDACEGMQHKNEGDSFHGCRFLCVRQRQPGGACDCSARQQPQAERRGMSRLLDLTF